MDYEMFRKRYISLLENVLKDPETNLIKDIVLNNIEIFKINKNIYTVGKLDGNSLFLINLSPTPYYNINIILSKIDTNKRCGVLKDPVYDVAYLLWVY